MCLFALCACLFSGALRLYYNDERGYEALPAESSVYVKFNLPSPIDFGKSFTMNDVISAIRSDTILSVSNGSTTTASGWSFSSNGNTIEIGRTDLVIDTDWSINATVTIPFTKLNGLYGITLEVKSVSTTESSYTKISEQQYEFVLNETGENTISITLGEKKETKVSTSFTNFDSNKSITPYLCVDFRNSTLAKSYLLTSDSSIATFDFLDGSATVKGKFEFTFPPYCSVTITATGADTWTEEDVGNDATSYKAFYFSGTQINISVSVAFVDKGYFMGVEVV